MTKRFVAIWFRYLRTDWFTRRQPALKDIPFVLASPDHGRMVITSTNCIAEANGVYTGTVIADAKANVHALHVLDDKPELTQKILTGLAEWCIRFTPVVGVDLPDGLILDITGCTHLWGGEKQYLKNIIERLKELGYTCHAAMADTIGSAWAASRFAKHSCIIETGKHESAILSLPPASLRIESESVERLHKLGLQQVKDFIGMPASTLRRRFGQSFIQRLHQALGKEEEILQPVFPIEPYTERLPCLEPISTAKGIEIALNRLLETICTRLKQEQKGLRGCIFSCYRVDGAVQKLEIGTNRPSNNIKHLFKLFEINIETIEPALGIELFTIEAKKVEEIIPTQEKLWKATTGLADIAVSELLDRFEGKFGAGHIHRYLPDEHYWPERSMKLASSIDEQPTTPWKLDRPRPIQLLPYPETIEVTAPIPDYPPMNFRYKGKFHKIIKADGPERIEQEWWLQQGQHRDYYYVEDEEGKRYWLFRLGHYDDSNYQWYIHGFFA